MYKLESSDVCVVFRSCEQFAATEQAQLKCLQLARVAFFSMDIKSLLSKPVELASEQLSGPLEQTYGHFTMATNGGQPNDSLPLRSKRIFSRISNWNAKNFQE